jgi:GTP-binding protein SAR1
MDSILGWFKSLFSWTGFFQKNANIVFLGLDNAGKSTLLYML